MSDNTSSVDEVVKTSESSRARAQEEVEAQNLGAEVENATHLHSDESIREIILAHTAIRRMVVATAVRSLASKKFYFDKIKKCMVHEEDYATQMKAAAFIAAYADGLPPVTNLNMNLHAKSNGNNELSTVDMLARSPAALAAMERTLAQAKEKQASAKATVSIQ